MGMCRDLKDFLRMAGEVRFADVVGPGVGYVCSSKVWVEGIVV